MAAGSAIQIPSRLPLLLTHEGVLLPGSTMRTSVDSPRNMQLVRSRLLKGTSLRSTIIGVIPNTSDPTSDCDDLPSLHRCRPARPGSLSPPGTPRPGALVRAAAVPQGAEPDPVSPAGPVLPRGDLAMLSPLRGRRARRGGPGRGGSDSPLGGTSLAAPEERPLGGGGRHGVGGPLTGVWKKSLEKETTAEEENTIKECRQGSLRPSQLLTLAFSFNK